MLRKIYIFLVALYPILSGYGYSPQVDFGVISLFIVGVSCAISKRGIFKMASPPGYVLFFSVTLLLSFFFAETIPLRLVLWSLNLFLVCFFVDFRTLFGYYEKIVLCSCTFFIFQLITSVFWGVRISGIIPFIPTIYEGMGIDIIDAQTGGATLCSFFLEKSYFAQYLFPYLVIKLFSNEKKTFISAIVVSLVLLLSRSGNGAVLLIIVWFFWFICANIGFRLKLGIVIMGIVSLMIVFSYMGEVLVGMIERSSELQSFGGDESYQSSGFIRFFRGYYAYADMPLINKLFGANPVFVQSVVQSNYFFAVSKDEYYNGTQMLLLHHGLIACILFYRHLILMCWYKHSKELVLMVICSVWLMLGESYFLCARMFFTTCLMYSMIIEGKKVAFAKNS